MKKIKSYQKIVLPLIFVIFILALSGCFQITQEFTHNSDGTGKLFVDFSIAKEMLNMGGDSQGTTTSPFADWAKSDSPVKNDPNVLEVKTKDFEDDVNFHFTAEITFKDFEKGIKSLEKTKDKPDFKFEKLANGNFKYTQLLKVNTGMPQQESPSTPGNQSAYQGQEGGKEDPLKDKFYTIKLTVPNPVKTDSSAVVDKKTGEILWKFPMEEILKLKEPKEIWAEYSIKPAS